MKFLQHQGFYHQILLTDLVVIVGGADVSHGDDVGDDVVGADDPGVGHDILSHQVTVNRQMQLSLFI